MDLLSRLSAETALGSVGTPYATNDAIGVDGVLVRPGDYIVVRRLPTTVTLLHLGHTTGDQWVVSSGRLQVSG